MVEMPEAWLPVMNALLQAPVAWQTPAQLAAALVRDVEETTDLLCQMDVSGWLDVWEREPEIVVTFSVLTAERLCIHLIEVGLDETPRWARVGDPAPPAPKAKHVCHSERAAALDRVRDPGPTPDVAAERAELEARIAERESNQDPESRLAPEFFYRPTILVGSGLTPWPGPSGKYAVLCPACHGSPLKPSMYCLRCDRWGLDHHFPPAPPSPSPRGSAPKPRREWPSPDRTKQERSQKEHERERERARRKSKRNKRKQVQLLAEEERKRANPAKAQAERTFHNPPMPAPNQESGPKPASARALR